MTYDIILTGVGGQGVLSLAAVIATGAMKQGLEVRQSEVHGMAQRGGSVVAHLRIADAPIPGDLIGKASADMVLAMEPLEGLRYTGYLKKNGILVASTAPVRNIPDYPDLDELLGRYTKLPSYRLVDAEGLAKQAGSAKTVNVVMVGAASSFLPVQEAMLKEAIRGLFQAKGEQLIEANFKAFDAGAGSAS
ncbi:MAG: indolepyruvate oxidoreductase subunit beta [Spirochaetales bacterium]|nr:indolepyruvate oxidoreductase subunit beta [Spirochaetales bacterium]